MTSAWASAGRSHSNCLKPLPGPCPSLRSQLGPVRDVSISHASRGICISVGCEIQSPSSAEWDIYAALLPYMTQCRTWAPRAAVLSMTLASWMIRNWGCLPQFKRDTVLRCYEFGVL